MPGGKRKSDLERFARGGGLPLGTSHPYLGFRDGTRAGLARTSGIVLMPTSIRSQEFCRLTTPCFASLGNDRTWPWLCKNTLCWRSGLGRFIANNLKSGPRPFRKWAGSRWKGPTRIKATRGARAYGATLDVIKPSEVKRGCVLLPRRWAGERRFGGAARSRRPAHDYERLPTTLPGLHHRPCAFLMRPPSPKPAASFRTCSNGHKISPLGTGDHFRTGRRPRLLIIGSSFFDRSVEGMPCRALSCEV